MDKLPGIKLYRFNSSDQGTLGYILTPTIGFYTMELPWRDNKSNVSRIPNGEYECEFISSRKFGRCYWIKNVPGRSGVLIHPGNLAGDVSKGFVSNSWGCILLGRKVGKLGDQNAVLVSRPAVRSFNNVMSQMPFMLQISGGL